VTRRRPKKKKQRTRAPGRWGNTYTLTGWETNPVSEGKGSPGELYNDRKKTRASKGAVGKKREYVIPERPAPRRPGIRIDRSAAQNGPKVRRGEGKERGGKTLCPLCNKSGNEKKKTEKNRPSSPGR